MRAKTGVIRRRKHKKVLKRTKGYRMTKGRLIKVSKEADLHAGQYAYVGRKERKRNFRRLWIIRLNAYLKDLGYSYNAFIKGLKDQKIELDRKIMANMALKQAEDLKEIVKLAFSKKK